MPAPATTPFEIHAIPVSELDALRRTGRDCFGNPVVVTVNHEEGGPPLRCCLTEAEVGARVALVAHRPFPGDGPYAKVGPVYIHADACAGYRRTDRYPEPFRHRTQVLRAYGHDGRIVDAELVPGEQAEVAITRLLSNPAVAFLHSRNVLYGCYMFAVHRARDERSCRG